MKKVLLSLILSSASLVTFSQQVVLEVLTPEDQAGLKPIAYVPQGAAGWTNVPNIENPDNAVTGQLAIVRDASASDSLGCEALINGAEIDGKIAVVWRGACPFALKAKNAWEAGAIAVLIVNNNPGAEPIVPGAGVGGDGENVDVPVVMTDYETGLALIPSMESGDATAFIGSLVFPNNLAMDATQVLRSRVAVTPKALVPNASDLSIPVGAAVINVGSTVQEGVNMTAVITFNGSEVYNESANLEVALNPGDTASLVMPTFVPAEWELGTYTITYTVASSIEDDFPLDNTYSTTVHIDTEVLSYSPWIPESSTTLTAIYYQPGTWIDFFDACVYLRSPYASSLQLKGLSFRALPGAGLSLEGQVVDVFAYEWNDEFEDIADLPENEPFQLNEIDFGVYEYETNASGTLIYVPFESQPELVDNQHYLFCTRFYTQGIFVGSAGDNVNYTMTNMEPMLPITPVMSGSGNFAAGFGFDAVFSTMVHFDEVSSTQNVERVEVTPYPNPTNDFVMIPYRGKANSATLHIYDLKGKLLNAQNVNFTGGNTFQADMKGLPSGTYVFSLQFDDNTMSTFKVAVSK